jgi:putative transcriptional regulator
MQKPKVPTPAEVRAAREAAGLTQTAAATLIHSTMRAWQEWEAGNRRMHPGLWELFRLKTDAAALLSAGLPTTLQKFSDPVTLYTRDT